MEQTNRPKSPARHLKYDGSRGQHQQTRRQEADAGGPQVQGQPRLGRSCPKSSHLVKKVLFKHKGETPTSERQRQADQQTPGPPERAYFKMQGGQLQHLSSLGECTPVYMHSPAKQQKETKIKGSGGPPLSCWVAMKAHPQNTHFHRSN